MLPCRKPCANAPLWCKITGGFDFKFTNIMPIFVSV